MTALPYSALAHPVERTELTTEPPAPPSFATRSLRAVTSSDLPSGWQRLKRTAATRWTAFKGVAPTLAGFGAFSAAAYQLGTVPGLVMTGVSILAAEWKVKG